MASDDGAGSSAGVRAVSIEVSSLAAAGDSAFRDDSSDDDPQADAEASKTSEVTRRVGDLKIT